MVELIVLYKTPNDPEHFEKYYREVHAPLSGKVHAINGIGDYKYGRVHGLDGAPANSSGTGPADGRAVRRVSMP